MAHDHAINTFMIFVLLRKLFNFRERKKIEQRSHSSSLIR